MKYLSVISSRQEFNAPNMSWKFYLIGNKFNTSQFIENNFYDEIMEKVFNFMK